MTRDEALRAARARGHHPGPWMWHPTRPRVASLCRVCHAVLFITPEDGAARGVPLEHDCPVPHENQAGLTLRPFWMRLMAGRPPA